MAVFERCGLATDSQELDLHALATTHRSLYDCGSDGHEAMARFGAAVATNHRERV
jgi:hypothetical protein